MIGSAVIAGAGIGGMCAAIGLRRAGWHVTVVERWPSVVGIGSGLGVWPDAQRVLDNLGLTPAFHAYAVAFGNTSLFDSQGRRLCAVPSRRVERRGGRPIMILRRADLMTLLLDAASGCPIQNGVDVTDRPDLTDSADLVIGADGLRSSVRKSRFADQITAPRDSGMVAWRGSVPYELDDDAYGETWGNNALFGLTRLGPGITNWYAAVPAGRAGSRFDESTAVFRSWRQPIPSVLADSNPADVLRHSIFDLAPHLTTYVSGKTALIGDAAHAMTPNLGRGACEAILDAEALVSLMKSADTVEAALRQYDRARRPTTQRAIMRSRRAMAIATSSREVPRNVALRALSPFIR